MNGRNDLTLYTVTSKDYESQQRFLKFLSILSVTHVDIHKLKVVFVKPRCGFDEIWLESNKVDGKIETYTISSIPKFIIKSKY